MSAQMPISQSQRAVCSVETSVKQDSSKHEMSRLPRREVGATTLSL